MKRRSNVYTILIVIMLFIQQIISGCATTMTRDAFSGNTGTQIIDDYRGIPVLSAYTPLNFGSVDWVLLVEIDKKEAFQTIRTVEIRLLIIALIIGGITIAYLYLKNKSPESIKE